ncbi:pentatricopeptide repeat-containing protein At2g37320-like isoform X2 [Prosopis cineraria]|uniref:pentatricopeptide repeat-containing protein At2g37320-like isoform X2 n=1 Tax=Prosopis cineraria TaxID=364024 RepID=UPI00240F016F|nr:pentatricopeptide repeat-containing protein At2g37320-like isoform X2 [Prosopis cineraria]
MPNWFCTHTHCSSNFLLGIPSSRHFAKSTTQLNQSSSFVSYEGLVFNLTILRILFVLKPVARCSLVRQGGMVHCLTLKTAFDSDQYIGNTLLKMYVDCDCVELARQAFDEMSVRDVVSWSSMIAAYIACNSPSVALNVYQEMRLSNEKPNSVTLIELDVALGTALFEMYSKCGLMRKPFTFSIQCMERTCSHGQS